MEGKDHFLSGICNKWPLRSRASHILVFYLIEDILVWGENRPSEEVLDDTEVQDLVPNGHADPRSRLEGRWHGQHWEQLARLGSLTQQVCLPWDSASTSLGDMLTVLEWSQQVLI